MRGVLFGGAPRWHRDERSSATLDSARLNSGLHSLAIAIVAITALVCARLLWLQVFDVANLKGKAALKRLNVITIEAKRGTIYDRNGNVLAMSIDCTTIYCNPHEISDKGTAARILSADLGGEASSYLTTLSQDTTFSYVKMKVNTDKADKVKGDLAKSGIKGIYYLSDSKREYPYGDVGGQVLGVVGSDGDGLSGLEHYYNDVLAGSNGSMTFETGSDGTPIAGGISETTATKNGTDIVISLDVDIQKVAEDAIRQGIVSHKAESGSVVVTNPKTGEILALCSTPLFRITDLSTVEEGALSLKAVSSSYEPGSIFKLLTMSVGIEAGLIRPDSTYSVPAKVRVGGDLVGDDDGRDYTMNMSIREMLRRSSNAGTALVTQDVIGAKNFAQGIDRFGIGQVTGIDYPGEVPGIVKTHSQYDGASLGSMAFGQSLAFPMIQMVKAVGAIANKGVLETPHFLISKGGQNVSWDSPGRAISEGTAEEVTDMMRTVVQEGTAVKAQVKGYDIAGKTGTGEQADESGGYASNKYVSSLIGFAPAGDAELLVYVGLNGTPYLASGSAAPLFSTIMGPSLINMRVKPSA